MSLGGESACLGGTELVGAGRERPCPGGTLLVQPELFLHLFGPRWDIPSPLCASVSGSTGCFWLGWGCQYLQTGFPPADQDIPTSPWGWALFSLSQLTLPCHQIFSRNSMSLPRALLCAPAAGEGALSSLSLPAGITRGGPRSWPPQQRLLQQPPEPSRVKHNEVHPRFRIPPVSSLNPGGCGCCGAQGSDAGGSAQPGHSAVPCSATGSASCKAKGFSGARGSLQNRLPPAYNL